MDRYSEDYKLWSVIQDVYWLGRCRCADRRAITLLRMAFDLLKTVQSKYPDCFHTKDSEIQDFADEVFSDYSYNADVREK